MAVRLYGLLIFFMQPFSTKAKSWVQGRVDIWEQLQNALHGNKGKVIWVHVSSLGEFEQGRPLIEEIKERNGNTYQLVLTFFSPSGYELRKDYPLVDFVFYLPLDTAKNASRFLDIVKPEQVYFVKYDYWYHYLYEIYRRGISLYLISAIFRENQLFFKPYGTFFTQMLSFFTMIFVQEERSKELLERLGVKSIVAGDTRVDRVRDLEENVSEIPYIEDFRGEAILCVAGSTWEKDEEFLQQYVKKNPPKTYKLIIAPHEVHESHIQYILGRFAAFSPLRYSEVSVSDNLQSSSVLVIDSIGILSALYQYADFAYIGGGFGRGIHNTLEPATFGLPIVFGKKYQKFHEAVTLVNNGGAFSFSHFEQLDEILTRLLQEPHFRKQSGTFARAFIEKNKGAVQLICEYALV